MILCTPKLGTATRQTLKVLMSFCSPALVPWALLFCLVQMERECKQNSSRCMTKRLRDFNTTFLNPSTGVKLQTMFQFPSPRRTVWSQTLNSLSKSRITSILDTLIWEEAREPSLLIVAQLWRRDSCLNACLTLKRLKVAHYQDIPLLLTHFGESPAGRNMIPLSSKTSREQGIVH